MGRPSLHADAQQFPSCRIQLAGGFQRMFLLEFAQSAAKLCPVYAVRDWHVIAEFVLSALGVTNHAPRLKGRRAALQRP